MSERPDDSGPSSTERPESPSAAESIDVDDEKTKLYIVLAIGFIIALFVVFTSQPTGQGMPYSYFAASAFMVAAIFLFYTVHWYETDRFDSNASIMAFLLCGGASIFIVLFILQPLYYSLALEQVKIESGWWIFKKTRVGLRHTHSVYKLLTETEMYAGLVEEPAKFIALFVVPAVRRRIVDRRSGLYYAVLCAFGFAFIENIAYFQAYDSVLTTRANPAHAVFTGLWGAAYGSWVAKERSFLHFLKYMGLGIGLHALWNFCCSTNYTLFLIVFGATIWLGMGFIRKELTGEAV